MTLHEAKAIIEQQQQEIVCLEKERDELELETKLTTVACIMVLEGKMVMKRRGDRVVFVEVNGDA